MGCAFDFDEPNFMHKHRTPTKMPDDEVLCKIVLHFPSLRKSSDDPLLLVIIRRSNEEGYGKMFDNE